MRRLNSYLKYLLTISTIAFLTACSVNNSDETDTQFGIFEVQSDFSTVVMDGEINSSTLDHFNDLISAYPNINLISMVEVPGSSDDEVNLEVSLKVHQLDISTHLVDNGEIASGGVDFFLAGKNRTIGSDVYIGVHAWAGEDENGNEKSATEYPVGHAEHLFYISYYTSIGFSEEEAEAFYYFTINAAPPEDIHWMTEEEILEYKIVTQ